MDSVDLKRMAIKAYPKSADCLNNKNEDGEVEHIGPIAWVFHQELDDDRYHLMVIGRCNHCGVPMGGDDYASKANEQRYNAGLPPDILLQ